MKKLYRLAFVAIACVSMLSCQKEAEVVASSSPEATPLSSFSTNLDANLHPAAVEYYNNIKTIMYGTDAIKRPSSNVSYENLMDNDSTFNENPMSLRLQSLEIVDENNQRLDPFVFTPYEMNRFINELLRSECEIMSERFISAPQVLKEVVNENEITNQVIDDEGLVRQKFHNSFELQPIPIIRNGIDKEIKTVDYQAFFRKLHSAIEQGKNTSNTASRGFLIDAANPYAVSSYIIADFWRKNSTPGTILLSLPRHNEPWVYLSTENPFTVGHAGIITSRISTSTSINESTTLECNTGGGVEALDIVRWSRQHYLIGLQKIKRTWSFRKWKMITEITPIQDLSPMVYQAQQHIGKDYVTVLEFLFAKWAAPRRFTCTTYVWWCAKKAFGVNLSNWYATMITPSALYLNEHTYVINDVVQ